MNQCLEAAAVQPSQPLHVTFSDMYTQLGRLLTTGKVYMWNTIAMRMAPLAAGSTA